MTHVKVPATFHSYAQSAATDMGVAFTNHAMEQMWSRRIDPKDVLNVVADPQVRYGPAEGKGAQYTRMSGPAGDRDARQTLYVCVVDEEMPVIISAGWRGEKDA